jgi:hypothetical protein
MLTRDGASALTDAELESLLMLEGEKESQMPGMPFAAPPRRTQGRRGPKIPLPKIREEALGHLRDLARRVQADARKDKVGRRHGDARVAGLGDRPDLPRRRENRAVLEGPMPRRRRGMVEGIRAFRPCLDRRDAVRPDAGIRIRGRGLGDLRRQDIEGRLHGGRLRLLGAWLLRGLRQARDAARGLDPPMPERPRGGRVQAHPRRVLFPHAGGQNALARRRLGEIRARGQGIQGQDGADEQPVLVPPVQLREAPRDEIRQARRLRRPVHAPVLPRSEIRPRGDDRLPVLKGLRDEKEPQLQGRIQENVDVVRIVYVSFAPIYVDNGKAGIRYLSGSNK